MTRPKQLILEVKGERTSPNPLSKVDPASLLIAQNVVLDERGRARIRRGFLPLTGGSATNAPGDMIWWNDLLFHHATNNTLLKKDHDDTKTFMTETSMGSLTPPSGEDVRLTLANKSLYATSSSGIKVLDSVTGTLRSAGVPAPSLPNEVTSRVPGTGAWLGANDQVAYRAVCGIRDANGRVKLSAPSGKIIFQGNGSTTSYPEVFVGIPPGVDENYFIRLYRTAAVPTTEVTGEDMRLVYERQVPPRSVAAIGGIVRSGGTVTITTNVAHRLETKTGSETRGDIFFITPGETNFAFGFRVEVGSTPNSTNLTGSWAGSNATSTAQQTLVPCVLRIPDKCPDALRGEPAYFGALVGEDFKYMPPLAKDLVEFKGNMIYANFEEPYQLELAALADPSSTSAARDISFGKHHVYRPTLSTQALTGVSHNNHYQLVTSGTAASNLAATMKNMVQTINLNPRNYVQSGNITLAAEYLSGDDDSPGLIRVYGLAGESAFDASTVQGGSAWSPVPPNQYLALPGTSGNYAHTPDSASYNVTELDLRAKVALNDWTPSVNQTFMAKASGAGQRTFNFYCKATTGLLVFAHSSDGTAWKTSESTVAPTVTDGKDLWVRATWLANDGAAGHEVKFYTSTDGITFTQLGATVTTAGTSSLFDSTASVEIGSTTGGTADLLAGRVYSTSAYNLVGGAVGTLFAAFDATGAAPAATSVVSHTGETWTIAGTAALTRDGAEADASKLSQTNGLKFSAYQEPDAVALEGNVLVAGSQSANILRVFKQADGVLIFTDEGIYTLTGSSLEDFRVDPLDLTCVLKAKNSLASLNGRALGLANQGVVSVAVDGGVQILSGNIDRTIRKDVAETLVQSYSGLDDVIGFSDESERKYFLCFADAPDGAVTRVYNAASSEWTRWVGGGFGASGAVPVGGSVRPSTGKLNILPATSGLNVERKAYTVADHADAQAAATINSIAANGTNTWDVTFSTSDVGNVGHVFVDSGGTRCRITALVSGTIRTVVTSGTTPATGAGIVYTPITVLLKWSQLNGGDPTALKHFTETQVIYGESSRLYTTTLGFANDYGDASSSYDATIPEKDGVTSATEAVAYLGGTPDSKRVTVPRGLQRSKVLYLELNHSGAMEDLIVDGVSVYARMVGDKDRA